MTEETPSPPAKNEATYFSQNSNPLNINNKTDLASSVLSTNNKQFRRKNKAANVRQLLSNRANFCDRFVKEQTQREEFHDLVQKQKQ